MASYGVYNGIKPERNFNPSSASKAIAADYLNLCESVQLNTGINLNENFAQGVRDDSVVEQMKDYFTENITQGIQFSSVEQEAQYIESARQLCENNIRAAVNSINESATSNGGFGVSTLNAISGHILPVTRAMLQNNMFYNSLDSIVTDSKIINKDFEIRYLEDENTGKRIDISRNELEIYDIMKNSNPVKTLEISVGDKVDIVQELGLGSRENITNVKIMSVNITVDVEEGDLLPDGTTATQKESNKQLTIPLQGLSLNVGYHKGEQLFEDIMFNGRPVGTLGVTKTDNVIQAISSDPDAISSIEISVVKDNSVLSTTPPSTRWEVRKQVVTIENHDVVSTSYTPTMIQDYKNLHNVDFVATAIETTRNVLESTKDEHIIRSLNSDFERMHRSQKQFTEVDFAGNGTFAGTPTEWIKDTFRRNLNNTIDQLIRVINDPNVEFLVYGRPALIAEVMPKENEALATHPKNIGGVQVEFEKVTYSIGGNKVHFISSRKLDRVYQNGKWEENNDLMIILNPTNSNRTIYMLAEYQTYLGSDIRPMADANKPAITAINYYDLIKFEGVQGRMRCLNHLGVRSDQTQATQYESYTITGNVDRNLTVVSPQ